VALAVGFVTAVVLVTVRGVGTRLAEKGRPRLGVSGFLLVGGLAVGLTAQLADWLGADSQDVLFSGQAAIPDLIGETSTAIVLLLIAAKAVAYVVTMASGFRGGPIFPALFLGIGVATLPVVWFDVSPTLAVAIGAAAGMAAQTKLILSSILFSALLVGSNGIDTVSAAVFAAATAWLTVTALEKRAAGTEQAPDQVSAAQ
jgi:H+/Cl- antiporter ClcA